MPQFTHPEKCNTYITGTKSFVFFKGKKKHLDTILLQIPAILRGLTEAINMFLGCIISDSRWRHLYICGKPLPPNPGKIRKKLFFRTFHH